MKRPSSLALVAILLQAPLSAYGAKVPVRPVGENAVVDGNRVSWTDKDGWEENFGCPSTRVLSLSADKKYGACCEEGNTLKGSPDTEFHCCAQGHDLAGSLDVGFTCCPTGQTYDGTVCKLVCTNGKVLVDGKCSCPTGEIEDADGTCKLPPPPPPPPPPTQPPQPPQGGPACTSGLDTGKCYMFKGETGRRLAFKNNQYSEAEPYKDVIPGKFQLCRDEICSPNQPINPGHEVYIKDLNGSPPDALDAGQWLNNAAGGSHIGKTPTFANAGKFSFTKWPCGKYCLSGFAKGLGPACPAAEPSVTFYNSNSEACVEFELIEVPCSIRDSSNNCLWKSGKNQCCGRIDCTEAPEPEAPAPPPPPPGPPPPPPFCPTRDGTTITTNGVVFKVICGQAYLTTAHEDKPDVHDPETCQRTCAADSKCQGANWDFAKDYCSHHFVWDNQPTGSTGYSTWVAFRPTKKR